MNILFGQSGRRFLPVLLFALLIIPISACSKAGIQVSDVFKNDDVRVTLVWKTDSEGAVVPQDNDHPYEISTGRVGSILSELKYSEKVFINWNEREFVFNEAEVKRIAEPVARALAEADKNQWVSFEVKSMRRRLIFKTNMMTSGWIWIKNGKLHLAIGNFRFEPDQRESEPYRGDPRFHFSMESCRIDKGEYNGPPAVEKSIEYLRKEHFNWTVVDLQTFIPTPVVKDEGAPRMSVEERLEKLKELHGKGLITDEEYDSKRKEILSEL